MFPKIHNIHIALQYFLEKYPENSSVHYTSCCSLPVNILSLSPNLNSLMQQYIHFIQSTFTGVDTQPFASKGGSMAPTDDYKYHSTMYLE